MREEKIKGLMSALAICAFFTFVILFSKESRAVLADSMNTCVKTVIPAVFPLAVIGNLIGSSAVEFPRFLSLAVSKIFGVSEAGASALLPGLFAGFPVGASGACGLYMRGEINERDLCRISAFSVTPSIAFVVSGVGGMLGDVKSGAEIYISIMISVFLIGFLTRGKTEKENIGRKEFVSVTTAPFSEALTNAIAKSGVAMLTLAAFVTFFSQIAFFLDKLLTLLGVAEVISPFLTAVLEVSLGCLRGAGLGKTAGKLCIAFACAWGGFSVHLQTLSVCAPCKSRVLFGRILILRALVTLIAVSIFALY